MKNILKIKSQINQLILCASALLFLPFLVSCGGGNTPSNEPTQSGTPIVSDPIIETPKENPTEFIISENRSAYHIAKVEKGGYLATGKAGNRIVIPDNIKLIKFSDFSVNLTISQSVKKVSHADLKKIIELYFAFFGSVPEANTLELRVEQFANGRTYAQLCDDFYNVAMADPTYTEYSKSKSNVDFVKQVYINLMLKEPDQASLNYWSESLTSGLETRSNFIKKIIDTTYALTATESFGFIPEVLRRKIEFSFLFAIEQGLSYMSLEDSKSKTKLMSHSFYSSDNLTAQKIFGWTDINFLEVENPRVDVMPNDISMAYVIDGNTYSAMPTLINQFMSATCVDQCKNKVLIFANNDPEQIREKLKRISNLQLVYLIGKVPRVYETTDTYKYLSDHYYRALKMNFGKPKPDNNGGYEVNIEPFSTISLSYGHPTNASTRITMNGTSEEDKVFIKKYLEKNLLLRNVKALPGFNYFPATELPFNEGDFYQAFNNHPLYLQSQVASITSGNAIFKKYSFIQCLTSGIERCDIEAHGDPLGILIKGDASGDFESFIGSDLLNLSVKARFISFESCSVGKFSYPYYFAGAMLGTGDTLLVRAFTEIAFISSDSKTESIPYFDTALGAGRSYASSYSILSSGEVEHYYGDPTVKMRDIDLSKPRPKLLINNKRYHQEFYENIVFEDSVDRAIKKRTVTFFNDGDKDLIIYGSVFSGFVDTDNKLYPKTLGISSIPFQVLNSPYYSDRRGTYNLTIPSKGSYILQFSFEPLVRKSSNNLPNVFVLGLHETQWHFSTNDPEIGSFAIKMSGLAR